MDNFRLLFTATVFLYDENRLLRSFDEDRLPYFIDRGASKPLHAATRTQKLP